MSKIFTAISGVLLLIFALAHAVRAILGLPVTIGTYELPVVTSWACAAILAVLGIMIFVELPREKNTPED